MIHYLLLEEVLKMHRRFISLFGGLEGIRDQDLLLSALEMPKMCAFGIELHPTIYDKGAAYLFHLVQNHPFNDGNKRTGFGAAVLFLKMNKAPILFEKGDFENLVVEVAQGIHSKEEISIFFQQGRRP
jgi:death-on-curing protein